MNIFLFSKKPKLICSLNKYLKDNNNKVKDDFSPFNTLEAETMCGYNGAATGLTSPLRVQ